ncbi:Primase C terminal 2 (PriCT-2) [Sulfitobacter marinus]|uniref:Primase C terminal 2 (PriCT-2) n=1 Tax=Sulfitobacter marinus TaxID=394264 RepID=A0A1I6RUB9_9RHOB|nr:bifunctional DNA primase/polymerase [Sulfitobacter marinus]SFS68048.1 Primase C terminal 2 (PriCT-2) [Sulfitobacter marinus]
MTGKTDPAQMTVLSAAGYTLIALHPWDAKTKCPRTGRLRLRGKSPIHNDWTTRPYRNADALEHARKGGNVGVRLATSDLVVDVDPRNIDGGQKGKLSALKAIGLNPDHFPTVLTGGGGLHLYMTKPPHLSVVDGLPDVPGIEFKTFGRQVVAPGSLHPSGKPYLWSSVPDDLWLGAPGAPEKLLRLIRRPKQPVALSGQGIGEHPPEEIAAILAKLDPEDFRDHDKWLQLMMACHHASAGDAKDEFVEWCTADPLYSTDGPEIAYRWDSLRRHGIGLGTLYMFMREAGAAHLIDRRPHYDFPDDLSNLEAVQ